MKLVIVESPTKSKTIGRFIGGKYQVVSCNGHIRDLPKSKLGIEVEKNFEPQYVIPTKKRKKVNEIKKLAKKSDTVIFASDEDREGEAIAWHLKKIITDQNKDQKTKRITFHEITEEAIKKSLKNPREIDQNLVAAQKARRILDRLVGYKLSPLLWKKVVKGLSAGRVQSPALRLIVEREKQRKAFKPKEYWTIETELQTQDLKEKIIAELDKKDNKKINKLDISNKKQVNEILKTLEKSDYKVIKVTKKEKNKSPKPPFTTSTLQQQASNTLNFSSKKTMYLAQKLYEGIKLGKETVGLITYPRTDSFNLASKFISGAQNYIEKNFGKEYSNKRLYKTKSKNAQEAHEAIRPTFVEKNPVKIKDFLTKDQFKLYKLIWNRALSSQMSKYKYLSIRADIKAREFILKTSGLSTQFDGWMKLYPKKQKEKHIPSLKKDQTLNLLKINPEQHFTTPPARFTEAKLIKELEKHGIGRPSTYAPIISTIQRRNYVKKEQYRFYPTKIGNTVIKLLKNHFPNIVDYEFTAKMENNLDEIASKGKDYKKMIKDFYLPFNKRLKNKMNQIEKQFKDEKTDKKCPKCGEPMVIKTGRYGKFLACSGFPKCKYTETLEENKPKEINVKCPECQSNMVEKRTRKGKIFYGCSNWPKCNFALWQKPTGEKCPKCGSLLVENKSGKIYCSNKECKKTK